MDPNAYQRGFNGGPPIPDGLDPLDFNVNAYAAGAWQAHEDWCARQARASQRGPSGGARGSDRPRSTTPGYQPSAEETQAVNRRLAFIGWLALLYIMGFFSWPLWVPCFLGILAGLFALCAPQAYVRLGTRLDAKLQAITARCRR